MFLSVNNILLGLQKFGLKILLIKMNWNVQYLQHFSATLLYFFSCSGIQSSGEPQSVQIQSVIEYLWGSTTAYLLFFRLEKEIAKSYRLPVLHSANPMPLLPDQPVIY